MTSDPAGSAILPMSIAPATGDLRRFRSYVIDLVSGEHGDKPDESSAVLLGDDGWAKYILLACIERDTSDPFPADLVDALSTAHDWWGAAEVKWSQQPGHGL